MEKNIQHWFNWFKKHASENVSGGWDFMIDMMFEDFESEVNSYYIQDFDSAFEHFSRFALIRYSVNQGAAPLPQ